MAANLAGSPWGRGNGLRAAVWGGAAGGLLLPAVAMRYTREVQWDGVDFATMSYSGSGDVTALVSTPSGDSRGCFESDFAGFTAGNIALVLRGTPAGFPGVPARFG